MDLKILYVGVQMAFSISIFGWSSYFISFTFVFWSNISWASSAIYAHGHDRANGPGKGIQIFLFSNIRKTRIETCLKGASLGHKVKFLSGSLTGYSNGVSQFGSELLNELLNQSNQMDAGKEVTKEKVQVKSAEKMEPAEGEDRRHCLSIWSHIFSMMTDLLVQTYGVSLELARVDGYKLGMAQMCVGAHQVRMERPRKNNSSKIPHIFK